MSQKREALPWTASSNKILHIFKILLVTNENRRNSSGDLRKIRNALDEFRNGSRWIPPFVLNLEFRSKYAFVHYRPEVAFHYFAPLFIITWKLPSFNMSQSQQRTMCVAWVRQADTSWVRPARTFRARNQYAHKFFTKLISYQAMVSPLHVGASHNESPTLVVYETIGNEQLKQMEICLWNFRGQSWR